MDKFSFQFSNLALVKMRFKGLYFGFFLLSGLIIGCTPAATISSVPFEPTATRTQIVLPTAGIPTSTPTPPLKATATPICDQVTGNLVATNYEGVVESDDIRVLVHLPPCYDIYGREYPVLYVLHGYPLDENHWLDLGIIETVEEGYSTGRWPHFIIVMPQIPNVLNVNTDGGEGSYEQEFIEGLIPFILESYRTMVGVDSTRLAGVSRGGVWSLEIGLRNNDIFGTVAALSPALHVNHPRPAYDPFSLVGDPDNLPDRLFLSIGTDEGGFYEKTVEFALHLDSLGISHTYLETPGGHENSTWRAIMGELIAFITADW